MLSKAQEIAKARGGQCLATSWTGIKTKIDWQCAEGHIWTATYNQLAYAKSWCPQCATVRRAKVLSARNYDNITKQMEKHELKCLTPADEYVNGNEPLLIKCLRCPTPHTFKKAWVWLKIHMRCNVQRELLFNPNEQMREERLMKLTLEYAARMKRQAEELAIDREAKQQKQIAEKRLSMDVLLAQDVSQRQSAIKLLDADNDQRYAKSQSRMSFVSHMSGGCVECNGTLESYNKTMCTSCDAREKVQSQAAFDEIDELVKRTKALNSRI